MDVVKATPSLHTFFEFAEFLATKIRKNKTIKGININNIELKISQYADDTSALLDGTERSLNQTLEELSRFSKIPRLNITFDKTQLVWIGSEKFSTRSIKTKWNFSWGSNQFNLLGILFNTDLDKMIENNYIPKVTQMEKILKQWNKRSLSPVIKLLLYQYLIFFLHLYQIQMSKYMKL